MFEPSQDVLGLLKQHDFNYIEVAFHESEVQLLTGPSLLAPTDNACPLKDIILSVTTVLSLPITGKKTLQNQGTFGFYFHNSRVYGVTACHVLFGLNHFILLPLIGEFGLMKWSIMGFILLRVSFVLKCLFVYFTCLLFWPSMNISV